tara:strand:- start:688 stop:978 length:291 start_codon:yes stop_codon:yes gene_type:complete
MRNFRLNAALALTDFTIQIDSAVVTFFETQASFAIKSQSNLITLPPLCINSVNYDAAMSNIEADQKSRFYADVIQMFQAKSITQRRDPAIPKKHIN